MTTNLMEHQYIPSKIIITNLFNSSVTQKVLRNVADRIEAIKQGLKKEGVRFLFAQKNFKLLVGHNKIFEIRSNIKGHRILFKFAKDLKDNLSLDNATKLFIEKCDAYDVFFLKYVDEHDEISKAATKVKHVQITANRINKINKVQEDEIIKIDETQIKKLYYYQSYEYLIPVLNDQQKSIVYDNEKYVLVQGIAGSGKTNICIQKCVIEALKDSENKVLYSTYSKALLDYTKTFILKNYIIPIESIINKFDTVGDNVEMIASMVSDLNINVTEYEYTKETFVKYSQRLQNIDYLMLADIANIKTIDFEQFNTFFKYELSHALINNIKNENLAAEVIFKDIEGIIFGFFSQKKCDEYDLSIWKFRHNITSYDEYYDIRKKDFTSKQIKVIYRVALDYLDYLEKGKIYNKPTDKNIVAFEIYKNELLRKRKSPNYYKYDIVILDEVQDFTQKEILAFSSLATKIFAVGDTRQMINPSYFSFDVVKRLLNIPYGEYELTLNYRNTEMLNSAVKDLINFGINKFGNWNDFTNEIETPKTNDTSYLYFSKYKKVLDDLLATDFENYVLIVPTKEEKNKFDVKDLLQIQTVSEFKGKESDLVILYNVLSTYKNYWNDINNGLQTKNMNVNSLYRYYYNLFYVGITRAAKHLLIIEDDLPVVFKDEQFFKNFEQIDENASIDMLKDKLDLRIYNDKERSLKIDEYIKKKKYKNALYHIDLIKKESLKKRKQEYYNIYVEYMDNKKYIEAVDKFLELHCIDDAIEVCALMGKYDEVFVLNSIYKSGEEVSFGKLLNLQFTTQSSIIKKIATEGLKKQREKTITTSQVIRELMREFRNE